MSLPPKGTAAQQTVSDAEQAVLQMPNKSAQQTSLNRMITICWGVIVFTFILSYGFEVSKGLRSVPYMLYFSASMLVPLLVCILHCLHQPDDPQYGIWVTGGYFIMYAFALLTGNTTMVFSYILPMLSFMVLLHRPGLVFWSGVAALIINLMSVYMRFTAGEITTENSRDIEIQLALIVFCFAGAWLSSRMYERITESNEEAFARVLQQQNRIQGLENVVMVDKLTGLGNRAAFDWTAAEISGRNAPVGVIFCDANGLKYRNDHMGHQAGDQLLCDIADKLREHFRPSGCFRISGDEFVILVPDLEESVFSVRAERFHNDIWGVPVPIMAVGWDHSPDNISEAIKNAEIRMYADKKLFYKQHELYKR